MLRSRLVPIGLLLCSSVMWSAQGAAAQSCDSSFKVDSSKTIVLEPWDNVQGTTLVLSCAEAELSRQRVVRDGLAFLNDESTLTIARVEAEIESLMKDLRLLQAELQNANTQEK